MGAFNRLYLLRLNGFRTAVVSLSGDVFLTAVIPLYSVELEQLIQKAEPVPLVQPE